MKKYPHTKQPFWFKVYLWFRHIIKKPFIKDRFTIYLIGLSIIINSIIWLYLKSNLELNLFNIVLHYRVYEGATVINVPKFAFQLPLIGIILLLISSSISLFFYRKDRFISYMNVVMGLTAQLILFGASINLVLANK